ncbi:MAG: hypothetical protein J6386_11480 [Candidatus Synoicihabitans palmerolidicus]|nr:hypothetical protein [Candidatus Synoicihabitans palmerolidicus]
MLKLGALGPSWRTVRQARLNFQRMVTAAPSGGLGNQMFQYAHALTHARRLGVPLALDLRWYEKGNRAFELRHFALSARILSTSQAETLQPNDLFDQYKAFRLLPRENSINAYSRGSKSAA